jgi:imidazolonepropionase-like amidohydrolase
MRRSHGLAVAMLWVLALAFTTGDAQQPPVIAIRAGHLIDPATGAVATNQIVLINEGKIIEVGSKLSIPPGADIRDLTNSLVK